MHCPLTCLADISRTLYEIWIGMKSQVSDKKRLVLQKKPILDLSCTTLVWDLISISCSCLPDRQPVHNPDEFGISGKAPRGLKAISPLARGVQILVVDQL